MDFEELKKSLDFSKCNVENEDVAYILNKAEDVRKANKHVKKYLLNMIQTCTNAIDSLNTQECLLSSMLHTLNLEDQEMLIQLNTILNSAINTLKTFLILSEYEE